MDRLKVLLVVVLLVDVLAVGVVASSMLGGNGGQDLSEITPLPGF